MKKIFEGGKLIYKKPDIEEIRNKAKSEQGKLWDEIKRLDDPHSYYVDLSPKLYQIRYDLLKEGKRL